MCVWKSLAKYVKDWISSCDKPARGSDSAHHILIGSHKRAVSFFEVQISIRLELEMAKLAWSAHFDLLSDIDELNQCLSHYCVPLGSIGAGKETTKRNTKTKMVDAQVRKFSNGWVGRWVGGCG